jgi:hypothetical protein
VADQGVEFQFAGLCPIADNGSNRDAGHECDEKVVIKLYRHGDAPD